jgi:hypothetical protein
MNSNDYDILNDLDRGTGGPDSFAIGVPKAQEAFEKGDTFELREASCGYAVGDSRAIRATRCRRAQS